MLTTIRKAIAATFMVCAGLATIAFSACAPNAAHADEIVNVEYIVGFVKNKWDVDVPFEEEEKLWAANVEYLLKVVDYVNGKLNNGEKTNYGKSEYATKEVVDTIAANQAIRTLIKKKGPDYKFFFTPETNSRSYEFTIGAAGTYYIDWGDGQTQTIEKTTVGTQRISHYFPAAASNYEIKLGGKATQYSTNYRTAAVSFYYWYSDGEDDVELGMIKSMRGCLGCIFSTITDESVPADARQPRFYETFYANYSLAGEIPADLFNGVSGAPVSHMFYYTFSECGGLTGEIPENLFAGIKGTPAEGMFANTFSLCNGLKSIPENLFAGISGAPAENMFAGTFSSTGITEIPENLFAGIQGAPAWYMFQSTFFNTNITEIPENLFAGISGKPAEHMFQSTFNRTGITEIPEKLFAGIQGAPAEWMFDLTFAFCTGLKSIPTNLFAGIQGAPAREMFHGTFSSTGITEIPENLFAGIQGAPAREMFSETFYDCSGLESIPEHLFDGIDTSGEYQYNMFSYTFVGCTSLTGPSARINGRYLYEIWPDAFMQDTYFDATGLSDYDCIPTMWGGAGTKNPGECPIPETE